MSVDRRPLEINCLKKLLSSKNYLNFPYKTLLVHVAVLKSQIEYIIKLKLLSVTSH